MDKFLLEAWNACITENDTVYILGDLFFRNTVPTEEYLKKMPGKKHLIVGNHDKDWMKKVDLSKYFENVSYMNEISDGHHKITLCHYPLMTWNSASKGSYMVYGHIHNNTDSDYFPLLRFRENALNAGVDINHFRPVTFNEMIKNNKKFKNTVQP